MATTKKPAKPKSKTSDPAIYTDPTLRDKLKVEIQGGDKGGEAGQWSARKSQLLAAAYKKAGGGYKNGPAKKTEGQKDLEQWGEEKWNTQDGEVAIRDGETARYLPAKAWADLTPAQRKATESKKRKGSKEGNQFVPNTTAAKKARGKASK